MWFLSSFSRDFLDVTQVDASGNAMGTAGAKSFGDTLLVNKTIQHLNVSDNSFGKPLVGERVKSKRHREVKVVAKVADDGGIWTDGNFFQLLKIQPSEFEWESQVPAFCAGLAASTSLLSVSAICAPYAKDLLR